MDLYLRLKKKARNTRDRDVRIKIELFLLAIKLGNVSEACARRGFSRQFYYRWWGRFKKSAFSLASLNEVSRRPKHSPRKTSQSLEQRILWYRRRHYGARMIEALLKRDGFSVSRTTLCHILKGRRKFKLGKRARLKTHQKRYELLIPGQRLQMDVKYVPYPVDGRKAFTYVIVDECTRWRFAKAYFSLNEESTILFLEEFKRVCPFPVHCIQTDNGMEFTYALNPLVSPYRDHAMDQWCEKHKIQHRLIPPGVKELNGKVERSHRIDSQYFYWKAPSHSLDAFNRALAFWIGYYNTKRLHGGIGYLTPLEKLQERAEALKTESVSPEWETLRLKFVQCPTIRPLTKQDRQILKLETELKELLKKIA